MELKPGSRWKNAACSAEFVVVRPPHEAGVLMCGGHEILPATAAVPDGLTINEGLSEAILMGKRYFDEQSGLELLSSKPGRGLLTLDGRKMRPRDAKPLPASD